MSRLTKYLKQTCMVQPYKVDATGKAVRNIYGELEYELSMSCKCRHEVSMQDIQVANGSIIRSTAKYFLDESTPILADYRIDGYTVLSVVSLVDATGRVEGYEVHV